MGARVLHLVTSDNPTHSDSGCYPAAKALPRTARALRPDLTRAQVAAKLRELQAERIAAGDMSATTKALARRADISETIVRRMLDGEVRIGLDELLAFGSLGEAVIAWAMGGGR